MKVIKEEYTVTQTKTYYRSEDGELFEDKEQCEKYEKTAEFILLNKIKEFELSRDFSTDWLECSDENKYRTLCPMTDREIDTLNHLWKMYGGSNKDDSCPLRFSKKDIGCLILMGIRFERNNVDWIWFYNLNEIITEISIDQFELKKVGDFEIPDV